MILRLARSIINANAILALEGNATASIGKCTISWIVPNIFQSICKESAKNKFTPIPDGPEKILLIVSPMSAMA